MKLNFSELKNELIELYNNKYSFLYMEEKDNFIGFKFGKKDKYYIIYLLESDEETTCYFRFDPTVRDKQELKLVDESIIKITNTVSDIIKHSITDAICKNSINKNDNTDKKNITRRPHLKDDPRVSKIDNRIKNIGVEYIKNHYSNISLKKIGISNRLYDCLKKEQINNYADLLTTPILECYQIDQLGRKTIEEVIKIKEKFLEQESFIVINEKIITKIVDRYEKSTNGNLINLLRDNGIKENTIMTIILGFNNKEEYCNQLYEKINASKKKITEEAVKNYFTNIIFEMNEKK